MEFKTVKNITEEGIKYWGLLRKVDGVWKSVFSSPNYRNFLKERKWITSLYS